VYEKPLKTAETPCFLWLFTALLSAGNATIYGKKD